jgi:DNA-binding transcriptional regulator YhcF (GntR family)
VTTTDTTAPAATEPVEGEIVDGPSPEEGVDAPAPDEGSQDQVNAVVGEVVKPELSKAEARKLTTQIKKDLTAGADSAEKMNKSLEEAADLMAEAYGKKVWISLDHESWEAYVGAELGEVRVRLERGMRQSLVYRMAQKELSTRAVGAILGVDQKTVSNDLRQMQRDGYTLPDKVQTRKGTTAKKAAPRKAKVKPIADRFTAAIEKLDGPVGDLVALTVEDGFEAAAGEVAKRHRADVARMIDSLRGVQERMQSTH